MEQEMEQQEVEPLRNGFLTDLIILELLKQLHIFDLFEARRTCRRWYMLSNSRIFWRMVNLRNVSGRQIVKLLPTLRDAVSHLQLTCLINTEVPLSLMQIFDKLKKSCPGLEKFIIHKSNLKDYGNSTCPSVEEDLVQYVEQEYSTNPSYTVLPDMRVLSLSKTNFSTFNFSDVLPQLRVLDIRKCHYNSGLVPALLPIMSHLEELYLVRCYEDGNRVYEIEELLKASRRLRVLDIEWVWIPQKTILALKQCGQFLEELYLGYTSFHDNFVADLLNDGDPFPQLRVLCVRSTDISTTDIERLLNTCSSLTTVIVSHPAYPDEWIQRMGNKVQLKYSRHCNHFMASRHYSSNSQNVSERRRRTVRLQ